MKRALAWGAVVVAALILIAAIAFLVGAAMFFRAEQGPPDPTAWPSPEIPMRAIDASVAAPEVVAHADGGVSIEEKPPVDDPGVARDRWLGGSLRGHDNDMARMRSVTITEHDGSYAVRVANQFGFRCGLELDEHGSPARMTNCRGEDRWTASPDVIELECETTERDEVCRGAYMLGTTDGYRQRARFQLIRRLSPDERR